MSDMDEAEQLQYIENLRMFFVVAVELSQGEQRHSPFPGLLEGAITMLQAPRCVAEDHGKIESPVVALPAPCSLDAELRAMIDNKSPAEKIIFSHTLERWVQQLRASLGFAASTGANPEFSLN
jgi:hypothetical protein